MNLFCFWNMTVYFHNSCGASKSTVAQMPAVPGTLPVRSPVRNASDPYIHLNLHKHHFQRSSCISFIRKLKSMQKYTPLNPNTLQSNTILVLKIHVIKRMSLIYRRPRPLPPRPPLGPPRPPLPLPRPPPREPPPRGNPSRLPRPRNKTLKIDKRWHCFLWHC